MGHLKGAVKLNENHTMASRKVIRLSPEIVGRRSMAHLNQYLTWNQMHTFYMNEAPGKEHYRMLAEISHQLSDGACTADVGTYYGTSALALSSNPNVSVITYDIQCVIPSVPHLSTPLNRSNVLQKVMPGQRDIANIARCDVVMLDIDPHNGPEETEFVQMLINHGFRGVLVCDDINIHDGMKTFWNTIPARYKKMEVTHIGHWSGTGIVVFDPTYLDVEVYA
jgi:hypothetical protein